MRILWCKQSANQKQASAFPLVIQRYLLLQSHSSTSQILLILRIFFQRILSEAQVSSDFELVSREAFVEWLVRESTKGNPFQRWIPLPITQPHWASVKKHLPILVEDFQKRRTTQTSPSFCIVAKLMYKVLARLATNNLYNREPRKAFLKYFALAHLLFCLAIEEEGVLSAAEDAIKQFRAGVKVNLAYVQAASLLSREGLTPTLLKEMIEEAIHRGIPSMLKSRPELALFEASAVSPFRNRATAHWIQRRMMIRLVAKLFHEFIRPDLNEPLAVIVKRMFDQYGAPSAREMVEMGNPVRKIILSCAEELLTKFHFDWFPLNDRGDIHGPFPQDIIWESDKVTAFFRDNITQSIEKGYCQMPITQPEALCLRLKIEDYVEIAQDLKPADEPPPKSMLNFQTKDEAEEGPDLEESERRAVWLKHGKAHSHPFPAKNVA